MKPRFEEVLTTVTLVALFGSVSGGNAPANPQARALYDDLLANYNKLIRPVGNSTDRLTVKLGMKLSQIIGIDMKRQILITNVWVEQQWLDYKLKWNPDDYGGVKHLHVPSQNIWLPDIVLYNNADGNYEVTIMTKAMLHYSGKVTWNPPAIYKSSCEIDVEFFPFDEQRCFMKFGSWTYDGYMVDLRHINQRGGNNNIEVGMDLQEYYISTEWDVMTVPAVRNEKYYPCCEEPYPDIIFYLTLRRKSLFYTVNVIIPCVGISFLSLLVFYLPSDSGEKVSLSISILLSLTVFFLLLAEIIPPTSMSVPLLGKYLLFTMILVTFSVVVTIGVLNVNFRTPATHKMAPWVRKTFVDVLPKYLFIKRPEQEEDEDNLSMMYQDQKPPVSSGSPSPGSHFYNQNVPPHLSASASSLMGEKHQQTRPGGWMHPPRTTPTTETNRMAYTNHLPPALAAAQQQQVTSPGVAVNPAFPMAKSTAQHLHRHLMPGSPPSTSNQRMAPPPSYEGLISPRMAKVGGPIDMPHARFDGSFGYSLSPVDERKISSSSQHIPGGVGGGGMMAGGVHASSVDRLHSSHRTTQGGSSGGNNSLTLPLPPGHHPRGGGGKNDDESPMGDDEDDLDDEEDEIMGFKGGRGRGHRREDDLDDDSGSAEDGGGQSGGPDDPEDEVDPLPRTLSNHDVLPLQRDDSFQNDDTDDKALNPAVVRAMNALKFVAQHVKNEDNFESFADDWKYVAMVLDRILLWCFTVACVLGTTGIIMAAPSHYDSRRPIDVQYSKLEMKKNMRLLLEDQMSK